MAQHDYTIANQTFPNTRQDLNNSLSAIVSNNSGATEPSTTYAYQWWFDTSTNTLKFRNADNDAWISFATFDMVNDTVNLVDSAVDIVTDLSPQLGANLDLNSNDITGTGNINITGTATVSGDLTVDTSTLHVDSADNRVGIGTTSPDYILDVKGDIRIGVSQAPRVILMDVVYENSSFAIKSNNGNFSIDSVNSSGTFQASPLVIETTSSEAMRIDSSGNVLVGKTSDAFADEGVVLATTQSNAFTRNGANVMSLRRNTSDGDIVSFYKDTTKVGNIGSYLGSGVSQFYISGADTGFKINSTVDVIAPSDASGANRDNAITLGDSGDRWKDLYLGGNIYLGGTTSANALDDYEQGTFTPVLLGSTSNPTVTYTHQLGKYTKVGNQVTVNWYVETTSFSGGSGDLRLGGLPFSNNSTNTLFGTGAITAYKVDFFDNTVARIFTSGSYATIFGRDTLTTSGTWGTKSVSAWLSSGVCALGFTLTYLTD